MRISVSSNSERNRLSDHDMLLDLLYTEKHLSLMYDQAINEATNTAVGSKFKKMHEDEHDNVRLLLNTLWSRNWYSADDINAENTNSYRTSVRSTIKNATNVVNSTAVSSNYAVRSGSRHLGERLTNTLDQDSNRRINRSKSRYRVNDSTTVNTLSNQTSI